jgi:hypothetical protein
MCLCLFSSNEEIHYDLISKSLITSSKTLSLNKVTINSLDDDLWYMDLQICLKIHAFGGPDAMLNVGNFQCGIETYSLCSPGPYSAEEETDVALKK